MTSATSSCFPMRFSACISGVRFQPFPFFAKFDTSVSIKGFAEVQLKPGETKRVNLSLDQRAFAYYHISKSDWKAEPGDFAMLVGSSSARIELQG
jgi:hypothetical protein